MSATIMMPNQIESAIREMCTDAMSQAVAVLAEKYGFDADEASRFLSSSDVKIVRKRGPSPKKENDAKKVESNSKSKSEKTDKPKRGKTGYLLYGDEVRDEVKAEMEAALAEDEKLKPQDVVKAIAARWKAEDQSVRDEWNAKAKTPVTSDDEADPKPEEQPKVVAAEPKEEKPKEEKPKKEKVKKEKVKKEKAKAEPKPEPKPEPELEPVSDVDSDAD